MALQPMKAEARFGLAMRFWVQIGGINLGGWSECSGLSVKFESEPMKEGGGNDYVIYLPKRVEYEAITLKRAMNKEDSTQVQNWLKSKVDSWINGEIYDMNVGGGYRGESAAIALLDHKYELVYKWELRNVYPQKWTAPNFDAMGGKIAIETLQLVHEGFL